MTMETGAGTPTRRPSRRRMLAGSVGALLGAVGLAQESQAKNRNRHGGGGGNRVKVKSSNTNELDNTNVNVNVNEIEIALLAPRT